MLNKCLLCIQFNCSDCNYLPKKSNFYNWLCRLYIYFNLKNKINIILVNKKYIFYLNSKFKKKFSYTNTLSFYYSFYKKVKYFPLGDIFLSPNIILKESKINKINYFYYFSRIAIHSILHIVGFNHKNNKNLKKMILMENYFLSKINFNNI